MTDTEILVANPTKRFRSTKADMEVLRYNLRRIVEEMRPMTVRQCFYQAVVRGLVDKTEEEVIRVGKALVLMRKANYDAEALRLIGNVEPMPLNWIVDLGRWPRAAYTLASVEAAIRDVADTYHKELWNEIDVYVEIWIEKDGLTGPLEPVTEKFDVRLMSARGYASLSFIHQAASYIAWTNKPTFIYHFGDFDPSGVDASENIDRVLGEMLDGLYTGFQHPVTFKRVAVTEQQIAKWKLPTRPTKKSDTRAKGFGAISVELDAIEPRRLRKLVQEVIEEHLDPGTYERLMDEQEDDRDKLREIVEARIWE